MSLYNYMFSSPRGYTLAEYTAKLASGDLLREPSKGKSPKEDSPGKVILETLAALFPRVVVTTPHFDRASVRVKTIEDLFFSSVFPRKDSITGLEVPFVYRQKVNSGNTYHDYKAAIDTFLAAAKKQKIVEPYRELIAYETALEKETIFHYCYFYDIVSKVPLAVLESKPEIIHYYMLMFHSFLQQGNAREASLIKETILYLLTSSQVFREAKDKLGNTALYYCSDLEVFCRYLLLSPDLVEERNKCGVNVLLSSFVTRDIRLLILNFAPQIVFQTVKTDNSLNAGTEYLFYSLTDSFILRFIVDMVLGDTAPGAKPASPLPLCDGGLLLNTETKNTIFNTSKCFDTLVYLTKRVKPEVLANLVRNHKECYEVLFSNKIKVIGLRQDDYSGSSELFPTMEYITFEGHRKDPNFLALEEIFNKYLTNELWA